MIETRSHEPMRSAHLIGLRALLDKELRSRARSWRPVWLLFGYLVALTVGMAGFLALSATSGALPPTIGAILFSTLAVGSVVILAFVTPALTTGAISGERERRTLDLLLVTRASALGIVLGKLSGTLVHILFLLAASLPAFAIVYLYCGVPPIYLALTLLVAVATAVAHASLGLLLSAIFRRSALASVVAYLTVIGLVFGLPFIASATASRSYPWSMPASPYTSTTPYYGGTYGYGYQPGPGASYYGSGGLEGYGYSYNYYSYGQSFIPVSSFVGPRLGGVSAGYTYASPLTAIMSVVPNTAYGAPAGYVGAGSQTSLGLTTTYTVVTDPSTGAFGTVTLPSPWVYYLAFAVGLTLLSILIATLVLRPPRIRRRVRS